MTPRARSRARLLTRDLAAAAAFASMAVSGELPLWGVGIFAVALLLALAGRRPLSGHGTASAVALLFSAAGLYLSVAAGRFDLVIAASTFAGLITAQRVLAEPVQATDNQVHLTSLLMIAGGAALSGDLLFGVCLTVFAICIALSLGLGVLDAAARDDAELKIRPALRQIAFGASLAVVGGLLFFALFPRLSWNVAGQKMARGLGGATAGLANKIELGATGGSIKTTSRVVARVKLSPDPELPALERYFIASRLSRFDGRAWDGPSKPEPLRSRLNLIAEKKDLVVQRYELLPGYGQPVALALPTPAAFSSAQALRSGAPVSNAGFLRVPGREVRFGATGNGYTYTAWSTSQPELPTEAEREAALQLPAKLDPRVAELARQIAGGEKDPARIAERLEAHLRSQYGYTLELPGQVEDPLADFLFARKQGHCEYFATALTVLLRTQGVPARVAVGFFGGRRTGDHYALRAGDAHAWTEVLLPGKGFVTYDATPAAFRSAQSTTLMQWLTDGYERVESWWSRSVVDYSLRDQFELAKKLVEIRPAERAGAAAVGLPSLRRLLATAGAGLLAFLVVRALLGRGPRRKEHEASALLDELERTLERLEVSREQNEEISETARRLRARGHPFAAELEPMARRYLEARFGERPLGDGELQHYARKLRRGVRAGAWVPSAASPSASPLQAPSPPQPRR